MNAIENGTGKQSVCGGYCGIMFFRTRKKIESFRSFGIFTSLQYSLASFSTCVGSMVLR